MEATTLDFESDTDEIPAACAQVNSRQEDLYWSNVFRREHYYTAGLDYDDYAPAYCVGYVGHVQYGGNFEDAEKSLCANWERIKGDSRLSLDAALMAMRAAWDRMAGRQHRESARKAIGKRLFHLRLKTPSFKLNAVPLR
jgi:hypothetical protein